MSNPPDAAPKRPGRPATGKKTEKLSASVKIELIAACSKQAAKNGESLSRFVARAMQNELLGS